jgi:hypothetical protein
VEKVELNPGVFFYSSFFDVSTSTNNIVFCCSWGIELYSAVLSKCFRGFWHNTSGFSFLSVFAFL